MTELRLTSPRHVDELTEGTSVFSSAFGHAYVTESPRARLDFEWEGRLSFRFAQTMTEEEARRALADLATRAGLTAGIQCHLIIDALPLEVMPTILPQLQDIAEYEIRMWQVRSEVTGPDIHERWVSLPITG